MGMKNYALASIMGVLMILLSSIVFGAWSVTLVDPATSGTVAGSYFLNATSAYASGVDIVNVTAWNFTMLCTGTTNSSYSVLFTNTSLDNVSRGNGSWISTGTEDAATCTFKVEATNESGATTSDTSTSVTVDNTVPTAPASITSSGTDKSSVPITSTVTGAQTTACTISVSSPFYTLGSTSMTHSGDTCSYTLTSLPGSGDYILKILATDGTNTTLTTSNLKVSEKGGTFVSGSYSETISGADGPLGDFVSNNKTVVVIGLGLLFYYGYTAGWFNKGRQVTKRRRKGR